MLAAVAIILTLLTTAIVTGIQTSNNAKKISFGTEIASVQESVNAYAQTHDGEYPTKGMILLDITNLSSYARSQFTGNGETVGSSNTVALQELDYEKLGISNLKYGTGSQGNNDLYVVSTTTGVVYYAKGVQAGNATYFTMVPEIKNLLGYSSQNDVVESAQTVIFIPSETNFTNQDVSVKVKIPKNCVVNSVTAGGTAVAKDTSLSNADLVYNIYQAKKAGNYVIEVKFKTDATSTQRTAKYTVDNVDNEKPNVTIGEQIDFVDKEKGTVGYIKVVEKTDNMSGVKKVKYDTYKVTENIAQHFAVAGQDATNDLIYIPIGAKELTVYIEDNAGNYNVLYTAAKSQIKIDFSANEPQQEGYKYYWMDELGLYKGELKNFDNVSGGASGSGYDAATKSYAFDGINDNVELFDNKDYLKGVTLDIELMLKGKTDTLVQSLFMKRVDVSNGFFMFIANESYGNYGELQIDIGGSVHRFATGIIIPENVKTRITYTFDPTNKGILYINGKEVKRWSKGDLSKLNQVVGSNIQVGSDMKGTNGGLIYTFKGNIYQFGIYNYALTKAQVEALTK